MHFLTTPSKKSADENLANRGEKRKKERNWSGLNLFPRNWPEKQIGKIFLSGFFPTRGGPGKSTPSEWTTPPTELYLKSIRWKRNFYFAFLFRGCAIWEKNEPGVKILFLFQVRMLHGGVDEIAELGCGRRVRRCNWIRFLARAEDKTANLACKRANGQFVFEAVRNVEKGEEIVVSFNDDKKTEAEPPLTNNSILANAMFAKAISSLMSDSPLDLSSSLLKKTQDNQHHHHVSSGGFTSLIEDRPASTSVSSVDSGVCSSGEEIKQELSPLVKKECGGDAAAAAAEAAFNALTNTLYPAAAVKEEEESPLRPSSADSTSSKRREKKPPTSRRSKRMLPCDYCGKCFDRPSLLSRHLRTHTGERPHVCDVCEKGFSTSSSLNTHRRIHSGEKPHECGVCGKRFTASSNLYYHRMTHVKVSV